jgi:hypothetical protein
MSDPYPLGQAAWQHVKALAVDIGPRPAGSAAERRAFDYVGVVEGDGTLWPRRTDARLNACLRAASPEARHLWYTLRSGDFLPFLQRGVRATSLQTSSSASAELGYHTVHDTLDVIEAEALEMTAQATLRAMLEMMAGAQA